MEKINLKDIELKVHKGSNFLRTILCRPEFNKYRVLNTKNCFIDCENFWSDLSKIMYLKDSKSRRTLVKIYSHMGYCI